MQEKKEFRIQADFEPTGDQPGAIRELFEGLDRGDRHQVLLGATGTGKTFTISHVVAKHGRPTLVMSHNKTLAAQLYAELTQF
ncbi:MAG: DEAD/DEAH box helicase family protein, partial [Rhodothermales bacterium]|nr:DEAD/DEAH box helicase family protein [Rhodothermales bacterium]